MQKYYLLSLVIMTFVIPLRNAGKGSVEQAAKKTLRQYFLFLVLWGYGVRYFYWKLPE